MSWYVTMVYPQGKGKGVGKKVPMSKRSSYKEYLPHEIRENPMEHEGFMQGKLINYPFYKVRSILWLITKLEPSGITKSNEYRP